MTVISEIREKKLHIESCGVRPLRLVISREALSQMFEEMPDELAIVPDTICGLPVYECDREGITVEHNDPIATQIELNRIKGALRQSAKRWKELDTKETLGKAHAIELAILEIDV